MKNSQIHAAHAEATTAPTLSERIDAIERFLEQLVLLLEAEPHPTRESIASWLNQAAASWTGGLVKRGADAAFTALCGRVLGEP